MSFAGLPGTGKTTIARKLAIITRAVYLRIDEIEGAILTVDPSRDIGPESYGIAAALAASNLSLGADVITDCVNPWPLTRAIFHDAALSADAHHFGVEIFCSDPAVHRNRVETRPAEIPAMPLPDWAKVLARDYQPWVDADIRVDTALMSPLQAAGAIASRLRFVQSAL